MQCFFFIKRAKLIFVTLIVITSKISWRRIAMLSDHSQAMPSTGMDKTLTINRNKQDLTEPFLTDQ